MAKWTYARAQKLLMGHEGGYSNHPADPGGVTLNGVIQTRYNEYRAARGLPRKALTRAMLNTPEWIKERDEIYWQYYAVPVKYEQMDAGVDYTVYDYGVNSGPGRAAKVLRRVLGLPAGTRIDNDVVAATRKRDPAAIIQAVNAERKAFLQALRTCPHFCPGWLRRVREVTAASLAFAKGAPPVAPSGDTLGEPAGKATVPEPKKTKAVIKGAGPGAGAEEAIRDPSWLDWVMAHPFETGLIVLGVVAATYFALRMVNKWHKYKSEEPMPGTKVVPETKHSGA